MTSSSDEQIFTYLFIGISVLAAIFTAIVTYHLLHLREAIKSSDLFRTIIVLLNSVNPIMIIAMCLKLLNEEEIYDDIFRSLALFLADEVLLLCPLILISILAQANKISFVTEMVITILIIVISLGFPIMLYIGVYKENLDLYHYYLASLGFFIVLFLVVILIVYFCFFKIQVRKGIKMLMIQPCVVMSVKVGFEVIIGLTGVLEEKLVTNIVDLVLFLLMPFSIAGFLLAAAKEYEGKSYGNENCSLLNH